MKRIVATGGMGRVQGAESREGERDKGRERQGGSEKEIVVEREVHGQRGREKEIAVKRDVERQGGREKEIVVKREVERQGERKKQIVVEGEVRRQEEREKEIVVEGEHEASGVGATKRTLRRQHLVSLSTARFGFDRILAGSRWVRLEAQVPDVPESTRKLRALDGTRPVVCSALGAERHVGTLTFAFATALAPIPPPSAVLAWWEEGKEKRHWPGASSPMVRPASAFAERADGRGGPAVASRQRDARLF
ncbi:hypothetical protein KM043_010632 [Ampulex compressa]|nr:hypothetical protein KM043_010632 [Ampulex compressa]